VNPFISNPMAYHREPLRAEAPVPKPGAQGVATIRLYDPIDSWGGPWGVSAKEFVGVLDELGDDTAEIQLRVNSPGGEVWEGLAILNALRAHPAKVTAIVEGVAASAASFIAAGCDELEMAPNSELFVHRAWGLVIGNAEDMAKMAADLDHEDRNLASIYAAKAGGTVEGWLAVMSADTAYSAQEAVDAGLADQVGPTAVDEKAKNRFDLKIFNAGGRWAPAASVSAPPPSPRPAPGQKGASGMDLTAIRARLGLPDDTSDDETIQALHDAATYAAAERDALKAPRPPEPLLDGVVAISAEQLEQLKADAQAGRDARAEQLRAHREGLVAAAVQDGRIAPAEKAAWLDKLATGTGAEQVLAALKPGLVPVDGVGSSGNADLETDDDRLYSALFGGERANA
jgi:ATP-dependent Clp endopeptidase proteolytic subunit ClpP